MIKAILFDLDGVLVDAVKMHADTFNKALKETTGITITQEEHLSYFNGLPTKKKLDRLIHDGRMFESDKEKIFKLKQTYTIESIPKLILPTRSKDLLHEEMRRLGIREACVTNSIQKTAELMLSSSNQLPYMEFVISNESIMNAKPNPEGYLLAMDRMNLLPEECLIIEDSPHGLEAARASGGKVMAVEGHEDVTLTNVMLTMELYGY